MDGLRGVSASDPSSTTFDTSAALFQAELALAGLDPSGNRVGGANAEPATGVGPGRGAAGNVAPSSSMATSAQASSGNDYARRTGESTDDWAHRLFEDSGALNKLGGSDAANVERLRMNDAIAADPGFQTRYLAEAQGLSQDAYAHPTQYGTVWPDQS